MTITDAPPVDLAPRLASDRVEDFAIPGGREEEWRFAPVAKLEHLMTVAADAGAITADADRYVSVVSGNAGVTWLPTDRPSAVAWSVDTTVCVEIPRGETVDEPIVVNLRTSAAVNYGRVVVRAGQDSKATVVVLHDLSRSTSGSIVVEVADAASLTVLSVMDGAATGEHLWAWPATVGRDSTYVGAAITTGGRIVRLLPSVAYTAPGASVELLGAFLADGDQYLEHRIFVDHDTPHCSSNVVYKGALSGAGAHSVWIGDVLVRRTATGIDTYELNRNLLLDDGPRADSVPNLELETGDIARAGHASATGRFDEEQLFYLQARGIPEAVARQLVVSGFFADLLSRIPSEQWREELGQRIATRLGIQAQEGM